MEFLKPIALSCQVMHYPWGMPAKSSLVAKLAGDDSISAEQPYAELWVGAHPKAPAMAVVDENDVPLDQLVRDYPYQILGGRVVNTFAGEFPFLLKVLSIQSALSIQAHPDKSLAAILNQKDSVNYPDANHKPEIAIAVEPVPVLYGFREPQQVLANVERVPELAELLGDEVCKELSDVVPDTTNWSLALRKMFHTLMTSSDGDVKKACDKLYRRLAKAQDLSDEDEWILRLQGDYPSGDIGLFSFYVLNLDTLQPGEGLFVEPNVPHAYLGGNLIECMANSDNVVRAGLTGKFKDVDTLVQMLTYACGSVPRTYTNQTPGGLDYVTPVGEFFLSVLQPGPLDVECETDDSLHVILCVAGGGALIVGGEEHKLTAGSTYLIPASIERYQLKAEKATVAMARVPRQV